MQFQTVRRSSLHLFRDPLLRPTGLRSLLGDGFPPLWGEIRGALQTAFRPAQLAQCNSYRIFGLPWLWKRDQSGFGGRPGTVQYRPYWTLLARFKMSFVNAFAA